MIIAKAHTNKVCSLVNLSGDKLFLQNLIRIELVIWLIIQGVKLFLQKLMRIELVVWLIYPGIEIIFA